MTDIAPADSMRPLAPIIGCWRTSGTVLDEDGRPTATIDGTDTYRWHTGASMTALWERRTATSGWIRWMDMQFVRWG